MEDFSLLLGGYVGICIIVFLFFALLLFVVLLILRPLILWYFKINKSIHNQEIMNGYLSTIVEQNEKLLQQRNSISSSNSYNNSSDSYNSDHERYMPK